MAMIAAPKPMAIPLTVCRENPFKISLFIASSLSFIYSKICDEPFNMLDAQGYLAYNIKIVLKLLPCGGIIDG